jgi:hypothetical protein
MGSGIAGIGNQPVERAVFDHEITPVHAVWHYRPPLLHFGHAYRKPRSHHRKSQGINPPSPSGGGQSCGSRDARRGGWPGGRRRRHAWPSDGGQCRRRAGRRCGRCRDRGRSPMPRACARRECHRRGRCCPAAPAWLVSNPADDGAAASRACVVTGNLDCPSVPLAIFRWLSAREDPRLPRCAHVSRACHGN